MDLNDNFTTTILVLLQINLTAKAKPGSIPPPVALNPAIPAVSTAPPPPPVLVPTTVPLAVGGGMPCGTNVGKGGGAAANKTMGAATTAATGLCRNSNNPSSRKIH